MKKNIYYIVICSVVCLVFSFSNLGIAQQKFAKEANSKKPAPLKNVKAATIIIQPFQGIPESQVKYVYDKLKTYIPYVVLNKPIPFPKRAYYKPRNRYKADTLNLILKEKSIYFFAPNRKSSRSKSRIGNGNFASSTFPVPSITYFAFIPIYG